MPSRLDGFKPVYDQDGIQIYHGDCRKVVPLLPAMDLLLTDPPYGIQVAKRGTVGSDAPANSKRPAWARKIRCTKFEPVDWDDAPPPAWLLAMLRAKTRHQIIWGGNYFEGLPGGPCWLVWDKRNGATSWADCELAWTNLPKAVRMIKWRWSGMLQEDMKNKEKRLHPTQKPVALMDWCLGKAPAGIGSVLDPYMGSGSVLLAAQKAGLRAIGIERHLPYISKAIERLEMGRKKRAELVPALA